LDKYSLELSPHYDGILSRYPKKQWSYFITKENQHLCTSDALDFLDKLLRYDHQERITAKEAMEHLYFVPITKKGGAAVPPTK